MVPPPPRREDDLPPVGAPANLTPPLSPPDTSAFSSRLLPPRAPGAAHINLSTTTPAGSVFMPTPSRVPQTLNPYATVSNAQHNPSTYPPPEYVSHNQSFDISSDPSSPISPTFASAPYAQGGQPGEESWGWLRHEDLARPIFPDWRTGSSIATSDISSVRGGMFGSLPSLPGAQSTAESRRGPGSGPGSVASRGTRDRENFSSSSVPSYPSSRSGGSRPGSRWGAEESAPSVDGEMFPTSTPASPTVPYAEIASRLSYCASVPPSAPAPPISSVPSASSVPSTSLASEREDDGSRSRVNLPNPPESAATRPPRYSDTFAGAIGLEELINRNIVIGGQGAIPIQLKAEKGQKGESQGTKTVMLVQEDVWIEMTRLAGLAQQRQQQQGRGSATGRRPDSGSYHNADLEGGAHKEPYGKIQKKKRVVRCCGTCVIS